MGIGRKVKFFSVAGRREERSPTKNYKTLNSYFFHLYKTITEKLYVTQRKGANKKKFPDLGKFPPPTPTSKLEKHTPNTLFLQKKFPF